MQQGDFTKAAMVLRQAVVLRPDNADAWGMLGSVLKQDGKPSEAADALRHSIALDPGQPGNHVNLASVLMEVGDREGAASERKTDAELSRAASAKQKERFALDSGNLLLQRGQFAEATAQFRNAVTAEPNDAKAHAALADALEHSGAKAEAEAERVKAKSLEKAP
ncbi:MAG: tetratricopeptide repeat protein, partial [Terriglobus roseus]|nr:tetratricopeptide repeat protein [Terriglobus roseus]